jgi:hypothetical protein
MCRVAAKTSTLPCAVSQSRILQHSVPPSSTFVSSRQRWILSGFQPAAMKQRLRMQPGVLIARGREILRQNLIILACLTALGGCSRQPRTDEELAADAQRAVNRELGDQARYSLMESSIAQGIACGQATGSRIGARDFVYRDGKVILDDNPAFDAAAVQCDAAIGSEDEGPGGNSAE